VEAIDAKVFKKIDGFFSKYPLRTYPKNQIIVHAGDNPHGVMYLIDGQVRQYDINKHGSEIVVNVYKPPAFFPMNWAINKTHNIYFFSTIDTVKFRQAPPDEVVQFLNSNPDVTFNLLSRMYSGIDGILRRMAHLMGGSARTRLLYEIIIEARRFGQDKSGKGALVNLREEEIAARAGLSRETVSRELGKLREAGLIIVTRKGIAIKDLTDLELDLGDTL
jgi:CRP-like cAMP-binding protein